MSAYFKRSFDRELWDEHELETKRKCPERRDVPDLMARTANNPHLLCSDFPVQVWLNHYASFEEDIHFSEAGMVLGDAAKIYARKVNSLYSEVLYTINEELDPGPDAETNPTPGAPATPNQPPEPKHKRTIKPKPKLDDQLTVAHIGRPMKSITSSHASTTTSSADYASAYSGERFVEAPPVYLRLTDKPGTVKSVDILMSDYTACSSFGSERITTICGEDDKRSNYAMFMVANKFHVIGKGQSHSPDLVSSDIGSDVDDDVNVQSKVPDINVGESQLFINVNSSNSLCNEIASIASNRAVRNISIDEGVESCCSPMSIAEDTKLRASSSKVVLRSCLYGLEDMSKDEIYQLRIPIDEHLARGAAAVSACFYQGQAPRLEQAPFALNWLKIPEKRCRRSKLFGLTDEFKVLVDARKAKRKNDNANHTNHTKRLRGIERLPCPEDVDGFEGFGEDISMIARDGDLSAGDIPSLNVTAADDSNVLDSMARLRLNASDDRAPTPLPDLPPADSLPSDTLPPTDIPMLNQSQESFGDSGIDSMNTTQKDLSKETDDGVDDDDESDSEPVFASPEVLQFHNSIRSNLESAETRNCFDIHNFGTDIIKTVKSHGDGTSFADILAGREPASTGNMFLSLLTLANLNNVAINVAPDKRNTILRPSDIGIQLISEKRHTLSSGDDSDEFAQGAGPSKKPARPDQRHDMSSSDDSESPKRYSRAMAPDQSTNQARPSDTSRFTSDSPQPGPSWR